MAETPYGLVLQYNFDQYNILNNAGTANSLFQDWGPPAMTMEQFYDALTLPTPSLTTPQSDFIANPYLLGTIHTQFWPAVTGNFGSSLQFLQPAGTKAAPSYSFVSAPTFGFYAYSATQISLALSARNYINWSFYASGDYRTREVFAADFARCWTASNGESAAATDACIRRIGIGALQLDNGVTSSPTPATLALGGGSANTVVCWKSDGKTLGYATVAEITAGTCH
jgi:hypothetical protein